jgi:hypothetical protein
VIPDQPGNRNLANRSVWLLHDQRALHVRMDCAGVPVGTRFRKGLHERVVVHEPGRLKAPISDVTVCGFVVIDPSPSYPSTVSMDGPYLNCDPDRRWRCGQRVGADEQCHHAGCDQPSPDHGAHTSSIFSSSPASNAPHGRRSTVQKRLGETNAVSGTSGSGCAVKARGAVAGRWRKRTHACVRG